MSETRFDEASLIGRKIGTYEIQSVIGHGGMGYVYKAQDLSLGRTVAIKILKPDLNKDKEFEQRFIREARALAELDHPNIVQVYSAGRFQDILFIAMQLAPGKTLDAYIREKKHLSIRESLQITRQVAQALDFAHKRNLMHRDIKPTNVMIDESGRVKVMDFGLAKSVITLDGLTQNGVFYGTPEYGSPEQCETGRIDVRTDIFSLGVVLYEMLSGKLPFVAETPLALFKKISEELPISLRLLNPRVPKAIESLCTRMMEKNREKRIQSAQEVIDQIDAILQSTMVSRADGAGRMSPWLIGSIAALFVAAVTAVVLIATGQPNHSSVVNPPKTPDVKHADFRRGLNIVITDMVNVSQRSEVEWYRIAITDMLITQLSQMPGLKLPTRDEMLWKLRDADPNVMTVSDNFQERLLKDFAPNLYFTGNYIVQGGMLRVTVKCYKATGTSFRQIFVKQFEGPEVEFFRLMDDMAATILQELQSNAETILAMPASEGTSLKPCSELFAATYLPSAERVSLRENEERPAAPMAQKKQRGGVNRSEEHKWVFSVKTACEQVNDRRLCESLKKTTLENNADPETVKKLNESLRKMNKPFQVRLACRKCGTQSACTGCPGETTVQLIQGAAAAGPEKEK